MKPNWRNVMTKLYAIAALASMLMGAALNAAAAGPAPTGIKKRGSGAWCIGRRLRLGSRCEDPEKDGYRVSVAQPPETSYADDKVHKGRRRRHGRAGGPCRPQLRRVHHHRGRQLIRMSRHWSTSPPLHSTKVRVVQRSNRPYRRPPRQSSRTATVIFG